MAEGKRGRFSKLEQVDETHLIILKKLKNNNRIKIVKKFRKLKNPRILKIKNLRIKKI